MNFINYNHIIPPHVSIDVMLKVNVVIHSEVLSQKIKF